MSIPFRAGEQGITLFFKKVLNRLSWITPSEYANPSTNRLAKDNYEPGSRYSLQDLDYKYLLFTEGEDEFYDLNADPYELVNLIDHPEHAANREGFVNAIRTIVAATSDREVQSVSEEELERLRALGYIR